MTKLNESSLNLYFWTLLIVLAIYTHKLIFLCEGNKIFCLKWLGSITFRHHFQILDFPRMVEMERIAYESVNVLGSIIKKKYPKVADPFKRV